MRGQPDVLISVPFNEWETFVRENHDVLMYRTPLVYSKMYEEKYTERSYRFFLFDCSWALYNEVMVCANLGLEASVIIPYWEGGKFITVSEILDTVRKLPENEYIRLARKLIYAKPACPTIPFDSLSVWNNNVLSICIYLQLRAYDGKFEKFNIDWR